MVVPSVEYHNHDGGSSIMMATIYFWLINWRDNYISPIFVNRLDASINLLKVSSTSTAQGVLDFSFEQFMQCCRLANAFSSSIPKSGVVPTDLTF